MLVKCFFTYFYSFLSYEISRGKSLQEFNIAVKDQFGNETGFIGKSLHIAGKNFTGKVKILLDRLGGKCYYAGVRLRTVNEIVVFGGDNAPTLFPPFY